MNKQIVQKQKLEIENKFFVAINKFIVFTIYVQQEDEPFWPVYADFIIIEKKIVDQKIKNGGQ